MPFHAQLKVTSEVEYLPSLRSSGDSKSYLSNISNPHYSEQLIRRTCWLKYAGRENNGANEYLSASLMDFPVSRAVVESQDSSQFRASTGERRMSDNLEMQEGNRLLSNILRETAWCSVIL